MTSAGVLRLQGAAGNRAVAGLVAAVHRRTSGDGPDRRARAERAPPGSAARTAAAASRSRSGGRADAGAPSLLLRQRHQGSGLDDPLYLADRRWSSGQGPDDRVTGRRLQNWAIARGSVVVRSDAALMRMQEKDGVEPEIVDEILLLLVDLLRGTATSASSHIQASGGRPHPYPTAGSPPAAEASTTHLDTFEGSPNARESAVLELHDVWGPVGGYLAQTLSRRYNDGVLDAFGGRPHSSMELETNTQTVLRLRARQLKDTAQGEASFGTRTTWRIDDATEWGTIAGISAPEPWSGSFWIASPKHPLWHYRGSLSLLTNKEAYIGAVAADVASHARLAGLIFPFLIKAAGFALSFSPVPALIIAGAALGELGEEGTRDLTGQGRSFKDVAPGLARDILIDLVINKLTGGGGGVRGAGTDAAVALERAAQRSAAEVRESVLRELVSTEGAQVASAIRAGQARSVADDALRGQGYTHEVKITHEGGAHTYRRKQDGTWCRWSERRFCGIQLPEADHVLPTRLGGAGEPQAPRPRAQEPPGGRPPAEPDRPHEPAGERPLEPAPQPTAPAPVPAAPTRQQRLDDLARDHIDHAGQATPATRAEAEAALGLEEAGQIPGPIRRPQRGDTHSGDFVDGQGVDWDVKRPRSRDVLHEEIRQRAREARRPEPRLDPNRPMHGEFELAEELRILRDELRTGENVIMDARSLNPADAAALRQAVAGDAGLAGRVRFFPP